MIQITMTEDQAARLAYTLEAGTAKLMQGGHLTNMDVVIPFAGQLSILTNRHQDDRYVELLKKFSADMYMWNGPADIKVTKI
jgi:hypothetical protein